MTDWIVPFAIAGAAVMTCWWLYLETLPTGVDLSRCERTDVARLAMHLRDEFGGMHGVDVCIDSDAIVVTYGGRAYDDVMIRMRIDSCDVDRWLSADGLSMYARDCASALRRWINVSWYDELKIRAALEAS